ncbi:regulatory LuxR family protein [Leucobacter komagatae]|uniref:Regulatory LuxR family protein n=1 Tax=Leucobacter komagatae TaxID=55969 RepID=A0A542Y5S6_9MICO|nr:regulatory LuxR family protein [Leucobacter komagatae]
MRDILPVLNERDGRPMSLIQRGLPPWQQEGEPVYARNTEVQRIVRYVIDGTSVSVIGQHWSGRTELLKRSADALRAIGLAIVQLRGIEHARPLEAFKVALPNLPANRRPDAELAIELPRAITELLSEGPAVVLVDDIDLLDEASWVLLEQIHKATGVPIVGTSESRSDIEPDERLLIRMAHPVVKLTLEELRLDAIHDLLEERLGDQVAPSLSGRIHMKSGGLPGYAIAFADSAKRRAKIRKQGNVWHDGADLWSDELEGAFESLLYRYSEETREALEMLVATGPLSVDQATTLVGQEEIERLEGRGLVRLFSAGTGPRVTVNPPGISDYFRHRAPSVRGVRLRHQIEEVLGPEFGMEIAEQPQVPRQFADVIPNPEVPLVARAFRDRFEADLARTWANWSERPTPGTGIAALELRLTGDSPEGQIEAIVDGTPLDAAEPIEALYFRYLHARWLVTQQRPLETIEETLQGSSDLGHPGAVEALTIGFRAEQIEITDEMLTRIEEISELPGMEGDVGGLILIAMHALGGRPATALEQFAKLPDTGWVPRFAAPLRGLALVTAGRPQEALEWASSQLSVARERFDRSAVVAQAYVAVMALLTMSRYADATAAGSIAASGQFQAANMLFGPDRALMNALAIAARRSGRISSVGTLIERGESYKGRSDAVPMGALGFPAAMVTEIDSTAEETSAAYRALAAELSGRGYEFSAAGSSMLAMLLDFDIDAAVAERSRLEYLGGTVFLAYLDARIAHHNRDADGLVEAARWLRREHANDSALKYFLAAARLHREAGDEDRATEVREEVAALMASEDPATEVALTQVESSLGFTQREREIIDLVAEGMNNPAIASALSLSVRTVETHLRNIRRKSGALEREEIGEYSTHR